MKILKSSIFLLFILNVIPCFAADLTGKAAFRAKNFKTSLPLLMKEAKSGDAISQTFLAMIYKDGLTGRKNYQLAFSWYLKAAKQNISHAQYEVGLMYLQGRAVLKNKMTARAWFLKASMRGHWLSQYHLATLYEKLEGHRPNLLMAYVWFHISLQLMPHKTGHQFDLIEEKLNLLNQKLPLDQKSKGQILIAEWLNKYEEAGGKY